MAQVPAIVAGPVEEMVDRLSSTSLAAKSVSVSELTTLRSVDAERIFHALAAKLDSAEDLGTRPIAAEGMAVLCAARAELQASLVAFLDRLPVATVGGWVATGWGGAVGGSQAAAFKALLEKWRDSSNKTLSAVAKLEFGGPRARQF